MYPGSSSHAGKPNAYSMEMQQQMGLLLVTDPTELVLLSDVNNSKIFTNKQTKQINLYYDNNWKAELHYTGLLFPSCSITSCQVYFFYKWELPNISRFYTKPAFIYLIGFSLYKHVLSSVENITSGHQFFSKSHLKYLIDCIEDIFSFQNRSLQNLF